MISDSIHSCRVFLLVTNMPQVHSNPIVIMLVITILLTFSNGKGASEVKNGKESDPMSLTKRVSFNHQDNWGETSLGDMGDGRS